MHKLMQKTVLRHMLNLVAQGRLSADEVLERMSFETARETLHGLVLDPQRELRAGLGEVVFAQGKTDDVLLAAVEGLYRHGPVLPAEFPQRRTNCCARSFPRV